MSTLTITPPMIYHTGGVMVSMIASSEIDRGFIDGVMVSMLASSEVNRGFIG
jgi:hypothetical protein